MLNGRAALFSIPTNHVGLTRAKNPKAAWIAA
jgi:hypothetical protein